MPLQNNARVEAMKRTLAEMEGQGNPAPGTPAGFKAGLWGEKIKSKGKGLGLGFGQGNGPIGTPQFSK